MYEVDDAPYIRACYAYGTDYMYNWAFGRFASAQFDREEREREREKEREKDQEEKI